MADHNAAEGVDSFRSRARAWIAENLDPLDGANPFMGHATSRRGSGRPGQGHPAQALGRRVRRVVLPEEYGGKGLTPEYQKAFNEESRRYELPMLFNTPTLTIITPTILEFGTEDQKRRYSPPCCEGRSCGCSSSPSRRAGRTWPARSPTARDGDVFILNGSKIWSTYAWKSDYAVCVCRTDWDAPDHRGLSVS